MEGQVTEYLIATFRDYFTDVKMWVIYLVWIFDLTSLGWLDSFHYFLVQSHVRYIEERSFRKFLEACLEETIIVYVDRLLVQVRIIQQRTPNNFTISTMRNSLYSDVYSLQKNYIKEDTVERMKLDEEVIMEFFEEYMTNTVSTIIPDCTIITYLEHNIKRCIAESRKSGEGTSWTKRTCFSRKPGYVHTRIHEYSWSPTRLPCKWSSSSDPSLILLKSIEIFVFM